MAKGVNFIGKVRGKMGGVVFRVSDGKQIASEYNPAPHNPKSRPQNLQRFKFAFVQAIAGQIPSEELEGLGGRALARRSELLKAMLNNTVVEGTGGTLSEVSARLDAGAIPFARGPLARPVVRVTAAFAEQRGLLNVTLRSDIVGAGAQARCAIFVTPSVSTGSDKPIVRFADAGSTSTQVVVDIPDSWTDGAVTVQVVSWLKATSSSEVAQRLKGINGVANELYGGLSTRSESEYLYSNSQLSAYVLVNPE